MTEDRIPLAELLAKAGDDDFLRGVAETVTQMMMEADMEGVIGAGRHERSTSRTTSRNGYRDRTLDTRLGILRLRIPKLRQGSYFPGFLEPRRTTEKALVAVIQEAWISGVSTRRVDDLVQAMRLTGIGKNQVSRLCQDIDERVGAFLDRPITGEWPYLWLDAPYLKQREGGRIVSVAAIIAVAVNSEGKREIVGRHMPVRRSHDYQSRHRRDRRVGARDRSRLPWRRAGMCRQPAEDVVRNRSRADQPGERADDQPDHGVRPQPGSTVEAFRRWHERAAAVALPTGQASCNAALREAWLPGARPFAGSSQNSRYSASIITGTSVPLSE